MSIQGWFPNVHQLMDINFHFLNYYIFYLFIFNWRIIALQYCIGFCHTSTWKSLVYVRPLPLESPSHLPPHPTPLGCHRAPGLSSLFRFFFYYYKQCCFMCQCTNFCVDIFLSLECIRVELLDCMLTFGGTVRLFSKVAAALYIPTSSVSVSLHPYKYLLFLPFFIIFILLGVKWYLTVVWFAFPWCLVILRIFHVLSDHLFVQLLWGNVYLDLLLMYYLGYLSFYYRIIKVLCVFWIQASD